MPVLISHSVAETERFGESWGTTARAGDIFALSGDLGAGKTALVRGLARGLEVLTRVHSPTYSLINVYSGGRLTVYHLDLYRLETEDGIIGAGLEEYLNGTDGVTLVEWAERWSFPVSVLKRLRRVRMRVLGEDLREIDYDDFGA